MEKQVQNEIREAILNYSKSKKFTPCSKEELIAHFTSYYSKEDVTHTVDSMLENYELIMTS